MTPDMIQHLGTGIGIGLGMAGGWLGKMWADRRSAAKADKERPPGQRPLLPTHTELEDFCDKRHARYRREILMDLKEAFGESIDKLRADMEPVFDRIQHRLAAGDTSIALLGAEQKHQGEDIKALKATLSRSYGAAHLVAERTGAG